MWMDLLFAAVALFPLTRNTQPRLSEMKVGSPARASGSKAEK